MTTICLKRQTISHCTQIDIGMRGFEPPTPASRKQCATKLRHIPYSLYMLAYSTIALGYRQTEFIIFLHRFISLDAATRW